MLVFNVFIFILKQVTLIFFVHTDEQMDTNEKKPVIKPSAMATKKTQAEQQMTCERLLSGDDVV